MSQVSYGTITITDTTDLTTYIRYAKKSPLTVASDFQETPTTDTHFIAILSIPSSNTIPAWNSTDWKWSEFIGTDGLSVKNTRILYYLKTNSADVPQVDKNTSIVSTDTQNAWTSKNPTYVANGTYWTCLEVTLSDNTTKSWSVPAEDLGLTQAAKDAAETKSIATHANEDAQGAMSQASAANIIAEGLQTRLKYMWMNEVNSTSYPAGSYMASGNNRTFSYSDSSTYGFNSFLEHTKLHFRYNAIDLTTIGLDGLKLYSPILNSGNTEIVNSKMGINITSEQIHIGGNGEDEEGYIIVDTDGMKIYSKYIPIIYGGTSVYGFDMVAQIGANTRIGALESGHMLLQSSGLWLKEKNNIIGRILNSSVHGLIPNYTEIFKFQWDINTTLQTSFESTFGVNSGTLSFLCGIQSEDDIIWGSSSSVTIDGTTYSFILEESFTDTFIPYTCTITSFQQNTTRSVTVVVQLTYTAATSGPYTSFGQNANVQGTGGFAAGIGVSSLGLGQVVLGQYNQEDFHAKFIIGNGTDDNNRSNLLVVDGDGNLLIQDGFKIVNTTGNCIQLTSDGMSVYKGGATDDNRVASFGDTVQIGSDIGNRMVITNDEIRAYSQESIEYFTVDSNGGQATIYTMVGKPHTKSFSSDVTPAFFMTIPDWSSEWASLASGGSFKIGSFITILDGTATVYSKNVTTTFTKGTSKTVTIPGFHNGEIYYDGNKTLKYMSIRYQQGGTNYRSGRVTASFILQRTVYTPSYRFGEDISDDSGRFGFAIGKGTQSKGDYQLAMGKYNVADTNSDYALVIGNGTSDSACSNALAVTWGGDVELDITTDYDLYAAITALGWQNDVIV